MGGPISGAELINRLSPQQWFNQSYCKDFNVGQVAMLGMDSDSPTSTLRKIAVNPSGRIYIANPGGGGGSEYAEDSAHSSGDSGSFTLTVRHAAETPMTDADGDYAALLTDPVGRLKVNLGNTTTTEESSNGKIGLDVYLLNPEDISGGSGGGGVSHTDDSAFTVGTDDVTPMGAMYDDTSPPNLSDERDVGVPRMAQERILYTHLYDAPNDRQVSFVTLDTDSVPSASSQVAVQTGSFTYALDSTGPNWDRVHGAPLSDADLPATSFGTLSLSPIYAWDDVTGESERVTSRLLSDLNVEHSSADMAGRALDTMSYLMAEEIEGDSWRALRLSPLDTDNIAAASLGLISGAFLYGYDSSGGNWDRIHQTSGRLHVALEEPIDVSAATVTVSGTISVGNQPTVDQGDAGTHAERWMVGLSNGSSFISPATDRTLATAPFATRLSNGTTFISPATDRITAAGPFSVRLANGTSFITSETLDGTKEVVDVNDVVRLNQIELTEVEGIYDDDPTERQTSSQDAALFRRLEIAYAVRRTGTPTSFKITVTTSPDGAAHDFQRDDGFLARWEHEDQEITEHTSSENEWTTRAVEFPITGRNFKIRISCTGTDASNTFEFDEVWATLKS